MLLLPHPVCARKEVEWLPKFRSACFVVERRGAEVEEGTSRPGALVRVGFAKDCPRPVEDLNRYEPRCSEIEPPPWTGDAA